MTNYERPSREGVYDIGCDIGRTIGENLIKDIPKIGEMFPESAYPEILYPLCIKLNIPTGTPVDENTNLKEFFFLYCAKVEKTYRYSGDLDPKWIEAVSAYDEWESFEIGLDNTWKDIWKKNNPENVLNSEDQKPAL